MLKVEFCLTHLNAPKKEIFGYKFVCECIYFECILDVAYFSQEGVWKWGILLTSLASNFSIQLFMYPYMFFGLLYLCLYLRESWKILVIYEHLCVCE